MARYDGGFRRGFGDRGIEHDRGPATREAYAPGGFGPEWERQARPGSDADFRPPRSRGGGDPDPRPRGEGAPWATRCRTAAC